MSEEKIIECTYGGHQSSEKDFTESGLKRIYGTQCRKCKSEEMRKYRNKYRREYNDRVREYHGEYQSNMRKNN